MVFRNYFFGLVLALIIPTFLSAQKKATITGKIRDDKRNPVEFANIYVRSQGLGTVSDTKGNYSLEVFAGDTILLEITHTSYVNQSLKIFLLAGEVKTVDINMDFAELEGVTIEDERNRFSDMQPIPIKDLKLNPTVNQGIESAVLSGPGVQSNNELSSNYSVRGGSYAENLVYVNDIEVYRPFLARTGEQEGLSFPNPDMVSSIKFSAGGFDARYGDKMSSVLDIHYKQPQRFGGSFMASLLGGSLSLESASKNSRLTQVSGVRYRTNQYLLGSLDTQGNYQPTFTDIQSYWTYDLTKKWQVAFLGNYANNKFKFVPTTRTTNFGSINEALQLTVYFDGQQVTQYETFFGAISAENQANANTRLKFTASAFKTFQDETFSVLGQYRLDELERDLGGDNFGDVTRNRGVGAYLDNARNFLDATVISFQHRGYKTINNKYLQWGATWKAEEIHDRLSEWSYIDSAGYSVPINPQNSIELNNVIKGRNTIKSNRIQAYVQNRWDWLLENESFITATVGLRAHYWSYNDQTVVSPRGTISWKPKWTKQINDSTTLRKDVVFRFSTGFYYQPPFYRELRDLSGNLNPEIRAQRAIHYVLGADIGFLMWERPFKFIAEAYYKDLSDLIPYQIDNIRIRYYGNNNSKGYATGLDMHIHGEFIPGIESWANLSFLKTEEDLLDDFYYDYYNSDGEKIVPGYTSNATPVDSTINYPGYIPRPTDQLVFFSMFFQDEMPSFPSFKVHLSVIFGSGLTFGPPNGARYQATERYPPYRRVDIGFSKDLMPKTPGKGIFGKFDSAVLSLEVWNLLDINNTIAYTWIQESGGRYYGVPNYLTSRRVNLKLAFTF